MIDGISGAIIALTSLCGAIFTGIALLRKERREHHAADRHELYAYRSAWIWSIRTITRLRALLAIHDVPEPAGIEEQMNFHEEQLSGTHTPPPDTQRIRESELE